MIRDDTDDDHTGALILMVRIYFPGNVFGWKSVEEGWGREMQAIEAGASNETERGCLVACTQNQI